MILKGRKVMGGVAEGAALVSSDPVSFYGGVDPVTDLLLSRDIVAVARILLARYSFSLQVRVVLLGVMSSIE